MTVDQPEEHGTGVPEAFESIPAVARFDRRVELLLGEVRGHPMADRLMYSLSALADFSLLWQLAAGVRTLPEPKGHRRFLAHAAGIAAESLVVNQGIKRLTGRGRPVHALVHPFPLRTPSTSSFPSGHASSAFMAARLLSDRSRLGPLWYATAGVVAASRVHVRIHHASDVVGGAVLGILLGEVAVRVAPLPARRGRPRRGR